MSEDVYTMHLSWTDPERLAACAATEAGTVFDITKHCHICWLKKNPRDRLPLSDCVYLGPALRDDLQPKQSCGCGEKLRECMIHGRCRTEAEVGSDYACNSCPEHALDEEPEVLKDPVRHLLYFLYPLPGRWERHAPLLNNRLGLFNGRKIMVIAQTSFNHHIIADVRRDFSQFEIHLIKNDQALREVAGFDTLFGSLQPKDNEVALFAHGKGITRMGQTDRWTDALYETMMDYWPYTVKMLNRYPIAGSFLKIGHGFPNEESSSAWHYSGSWFWFRTKDLLNKPEWRRIDKFYAGIETYPSLHFNINQAGVIFYANSVPNMDLYNHHLWTTMLDPLLIKWKQQRQGYKTNFG